MVGCKTGDHLWAGGPDQHLPMIGGNEPQEVIPGHFPRNSMLRGGEGVVGTLQIAERTTAPVVAPIAQKVESRPFCVLSPNMSGIGVIDVKGYRPGTVLKDPYIEGAYFTVPEASAN